MSNMAQGLMHHMDDCNIGMQMSVYWDVNCTFLFKA